MKNILKTLVALLVVSMATFSCDDDNNAPNNENSFTDVGNGSTNEDNVVILDSIISYSEGILSSKTEYSYNGQGLTESQIHYTWNNDAWNKLVKSEYSYNEYGEVSKTKTTNYSSGDIYESYYYYSGK